MISEQELEHEYMRETEELPVSIDRSSEPVNMRRTKIYFVIALIGLIVVSTIMIWKGYL